MLYLLLKVRAGVEMALIDAVANSIGIPLWRLFGGASNSITTDITIPIVSSSEAAQLASKYRKQGFMTLKLKVGKNLNEEEREKGSIGKEVYLAYLTIMKGGSLVPLVVLAQSSFQVLQISRNFWMAWACPTDEAEPVTGMNFILLIYILFYVGSTLCVLVRTSLLAIAGISTAEKLFHNMLHSVLRAPMAFFDSTPAERILNRASTDQSLLDLELANKVGWCAFSTIQILGTIAVMSQVTWEVFIIFIPVTAICIWYQIRYAEHLPSVLKNITCTFPGRKKIGVVGRTGSDKSTLMQAIFRVVEPREGRISIDDVDISKIGL